MRASNHTARPGIGVGRASHTDAYLIDSPIIVHSRADIAGLCRGHRMALGESVEQFDARAGFPDRYVTKLERSTDDGRHRGITIKPSPVNAGDHAVTMSYMAETWLSALGLALVLMPVSVADSIGAVKAPVRGAG